MVFFSISGLGKEAAGLKLLKKNGDLHFSLNHFVAQNWREKNTSIKKKI